MNSTYTLTEGNDALNRVLLMMRYELGKTLDENVITEQVYTKTNDGNYELKVGPWKGVDASVVFPYLKQDEYPKKLDRYFSPIGGIPNDVLDGINKYRPSISSEPYKYTEFGYPKSHAYYSKWKEEWKQKHPNQIFGQRQQQTLDKNGKARTITVDEYGNEVKNLPASKMTLEKFIEGFRDALYSPGGIAVETFLTSTGLGSVGVISSYAALLIYDIYLSISNNDTNWLNIVFDLLGMLTSGALSGLLAPIVKSAGKGFTTIEKALLSLKNSKYWKSIYPVLVKIGESIGWITSYISKGVEWLLKSLGPKVPSFIKTGANKIISFLKTIPSQITNFLKKIGTKTGKVLKKIAKPGQATLKQGAKQGVTMGVVAKGIETGVHKYQDSKNKQITNIVSDKKYQNTNADF